VHIFCQKKDAVIHRVNCSYLDPKFCKFFKTCKMEFILQVKEAERINESNIVGIKTRYRS